MIKFNLINNKWHELSEEVLDYNWKYRLKICSKCPLKTQQKLRCYKINNFKIIKNIRIQETHCSKMEKARANKFRNKMKILFDITDFNFSGKGKYVKEPRPEQVDDHYGN